MTNCHVVILKYKIHTIENILIKSILNKYLKLNICARLEKINTRLVNILYLSKSIYLFQPFYYIINQPYLKYSTVLILPLESALKRIIKNSKKIWRKLLENSVSPRSRKLRRVIMNITISEVCNQPSDAMKGKIAIRPAIPLKPDKSVSQK